MDETRELFNKIKRKDKGSFDQLTENYGWKLYSYIRGKITDRDQADKVFNDTLARFHASAEKYRCEDPIEAMLCLYADEICENQKNELSAACGTQQVPAENPAGLQAGSFNISENPLNPEGVSDRQTEVPTENGQWSVGCGREFRFPDEPKKPRKKQEKLVIPPSDEQNKRSFAASFFYGLCVILLVLGILAAVWFLIGILVDMQVLPPWDLGYSWFNEHVINWF